MKMIYSCASNSQDLLNKCSKMQVERKSERDSTVGKIRGGMAKRKREDFRMASFGGICFLLACLLFGISSVQGDESSYREVCNKTGDNYYFCIDCFEEHQRNDLDYGGISITCARDSTLVAHKTALDYSNNSTGRFQDVMKFCEPKLDLAAKYLEASLRAWREQRKEDTVEFIDFCSSNFASCTKRISGFNLSIGFIREFGTVRARIEVADVIVSL
ncbi:hypothetical protein ACH5RR_003636 [Cinchona calisaya]|uniref:Pectinesterase inhibitor domain-containing protein n=2 Tax=Cinchona calisaya TaxID=153742 RepID=A0ABD3AVL6_9GENT